MPDKNVIGAVEPAIKRKKCVDECVFCAREHYEEAYAKGLREGQRSKTAFKLGYHEGREDEREHSTYPEGWKDGRKDLIEKLTTAFGDGEISRRIRKEAPESASSETAAKAPSATTRVGSS